MILSQPWAVKYAENLISDRDCYGICYLTHHAIVIDATQARGHAIETITHEVIHACLGAVAIGDDDEETYVRRLTPVLLDVLRSNPPWWK